MMENKELLEKEIAELTASVKSAKQRLSKKEAKLRKKQKELQAIKEAEKTAELVKLAEASREFFAERDEVYEEFKNFYRQRNY